MPFAKIRPRGGTVDEWKRANPILAEREIGFEFTAGGVTEGNVKMKMGDGKTHWNDLPYALTGGGGSAGGTLPDNTLTTDNIFNGGFNGDNSTTHVPSMSYLHSTALPKFVSQSQIVNESSGTSTTNIPSTKYVHDIFATKKDVGSVVYQEETGLADGRLAFKIIRCGNIVTLFPNNEVECICTGENIVPTNFRPSENRRAFGFNAENGKITPVYLTITTNGAIYKRNPDSSWNWSDSTAMSLVYSSISWMI